MRTEVAVIIQSWKWIQLYIALWNHRGNQFPSEHVAIRSICKTFQLRRLKVFVSYKHWSEIMSSSCYCLAGQIHVLMLKQAVPSYTHMGLALLCLYQLQYVEPVCAVLQFFLTPGRAHTPLKWHLLSGVTRILFTRWYSLHQSKVCIQLTRMYICNVIKAHGYGMRLNVHTITVKVVKVNIHIIVVQIVRRFDRRRLRQLQNCCYVMWKLTIVNLTFISSLEFELIWQSVCVLLWLCVHWSYTYVHMRVVVLV